MGQNNGTEETRPRKREVLGVEELSAQDMQDIADAEVPSQYAYLDMLVNKVQ
jgi:hypothetical protein